MNPNFLSWLDHFKQYCSLRYDQLPTENDVLDALDNYIDLQEYSGMSDRAFLKAAVFRMVLFHCKNGDTRLLTLVMGIVTGQVLRILSN